VGLRGKLARARSRTLYDYVYAPPRAENAARRGSVPQERSGPAPAAK
jgi:hypothetical protein